MGLGIARALRQRGYRVTLLERGQPGRAASWASAGIIGATMRVESGPTSELRKLSSRLWPAFAEALAAESGLDPEYRETGCLFVARQEAELDWLRRAASAEGVSLLDSQGLRELEPGLAPNVVAGLAAPGGNVENRRVCRALEIAARRAGVEIRSGVEVRALATAGGRVVGVETDSAAPEAPGGQVAADLVVVAAGAWSTGIAGLRPVVPVVPQRGQILALDQARVGLRHVVLTETDPYFVPRCDGRLVIGATREMAGWDSSLTAGGVAWLLSSAMAVVPALGECPIVELWTGFRPLSADGLPAIGRGAVDGLYFLTGHGPSGIAPLPGSVALLAALIDGEPAPVAAEAFSPMRFL